MALQESVRWAQLLRAGVGGVASVQGLSEEENGLLTLDRRQQEARGLLRLPAEHPPPATALGAAGLQPASRGGRDPLHRAVGVRGARPSHCRPGFLLSPLKRISVPAGERRGGEAAAYGPGLQRP